jgi:hypothetical protein
LFHSSGEGALNAFMAGLIVVAIFAVLVSKNSQTPSVLSNAGSAVSSSLYAAEGIQK